jgi:hypothetical protein
MRFNKLFTVGFRNDIYGSSANHQASTYGLELRDVTRNLKTLKQYSKSLAESISEFRWEILEKYNKTKNHDRHYLMRELYSNIDVPIRSETDWYEGFRLKTSINDWPSQISKQIPTEWNSYFYKLVRTYSLPFLSYETGRYFDYKTGTFRSPTATQIERIRSARALYIKDTTDLINNINANRAKGEDVDRHDVEIALKWNLADWAKKARVSELFEGI